MYGGGATSRPPATTSRPPTTEPRPTTTIPPEPEDQGSEEWFLWYTTYGPGATSRPPTTEPPPTTTIPPEPEDQSSIAWALWNQQYGSAITPPPTTIPPEPEDQSSIPWAFWNDLFGSGATTRPPATTSPPTTEPRPTTEPVTTTERRTTIPPTAPYTPRLTQVLTTRRASGRLAGDAGDFGSPFRTTPMMESPTTPRRTTEAVAWFDEWDDGEFQFREFTPRPTSPPADDLTPEDDDEQFRQFTSRPDRSAGDLTPEDDDEQFRQYSSESASEPVRYSLDLLGDGAKTEVEVESNRKRKLTAKDVAELARLRNKRNLTPAEKQRLAMLANAASAVSRAASFDPNPPTQDDLLSPNPPRDGLGDVDDQDLYTTVITTYIPPRQVGDGPWTPWYADYYHR